MNKNKFEWDYFKEVVTTIRKYKLELGYKSNDICECLIVLQDQYKIEKYLVFYTYAIPAINKLAKVECKIIIPEEFKEFINNKYK